MHITRSVREEIKEIRSCENKQSLKEKIIYGFTWEEACFFSRGATGPVFFRYFLQDAQLSPKLINNNAQH